MFESHVVACWLVRISTSIVVPATTAVTRSLLRTAGFWPLILSLRLEAAPCNQSSFAPERRSSQDVIVTVVKRRLGLHDAVETVVLF